MYQLKKSLLKQSLYAWFKRFNEVVIEFGHHNLSVFCKQSYSGCILLTLHMDDIVITNSDKQGIFPKKKKKVQPKAF